MNQNINEMMYAWIDEHTEELISVLQDFARIPSISRADLAEENAPFGPDCRKMLDYALKRSAEMGFEVKDHEGYAGSAWMGDFNNALGVIGHLDVVPLGSGWVYPPYGATRTGDFLIGRGVGDNKNACVMGLFLMRMFKELNIPLRHGLRVIFGMSEETGMQDMTYMVNTNQPLPILSLVPDAGFPVCKAQKGSMSGYVSIESGKDLKNIFAGEAVNIVPPEATIEVRLSAEEMKKAIAELDEKLYDIEETEFGCKLIAHGRPCHAAAPWGGLNAIHLLMDALKRAPLTDEQSKKAVEAMFVFTDGYYGECADIEYQDEVSGKTTLNIGLARTEGDRFQLHIDSRMSIAADPDEMQARLAAAAEKLGFRTDKLSNTKPFHLPDDHPAMNALMNAYRELTGRDDKAYAIGGGTYSRVISTAVTFGLSMKGVTERPADIPESHGGAHQADEFLHIPTFMNSMKIYAAALYNLDQAMA